MCNRVTVCKLSFFLSLSTLLALYWFFFPFGCCCLCIARISFQCNHIARSYSRIVFDGWYGSFFISVCHNVLRDERAAQNECTQVHVNCNANGQHMYGPRLYAHIYITFNTNILLLELAPLCWLCFFFLIIECITHKWSRFMKSRDRCEWFPYYSMSLFCSLNSIQNCCCSTTCEPIYDTIIPEENHTVHQMKTEKRRRKKKASNSKCFEGFNQC